MKRKRERGESTAPENKEFRQLMDLIESDNDGEEKREELERALEDKELNSCFVESRENYDAMELHIVRFLSAQSCSNSTTNNQDSSKIIAPDVKKKGPVPLRASDSQFTTREKPEPSCTYCVICNDAKPTRSLIQSDCLHRFCEDCFRIYLGEKIQENILPVKCPDKECKALLKDEFWRQYVPEEVFDRWKKACLEGRVLACPRIIECPFIACLGMFADDGRDFLIRACPKCWKIFCMKCRVRWHLGMSCEDFQYFELLQCFEFPEFII